MKLIAQTIVGNFPVKIYESEVSPQEHNSYGYTRMNDDGTEIVVVVDPSKPDPIYWETFWHEMGHVFEMAHGFELSHTVIHLIGIAVSGMFRNLEWAQEPRVAKKKAPSKKASPKRKK
jgi:hypothetical protein